MTLLIMESTTALAGWIYLSLTSFNTYNLTDMLLTFVFSKEPKLGVASLAAVICDMVEVVLKTLLNLNCGEAVE